MFDKEAQRVRALQFAAQQLALGVPTPVKPADPKPSPKLPTAAMLAGLSPIKKASKSKEPAKTYLEIPFTNELGQVIHPGQKVIAVSSGFSHAIKIGTATFLGIRKIGNQVTSVVVHGATRNWRGEGKPRQRTLPGKRIYPTT